jgi:predicted DNA binding protein
MPRVRLKIEPHGSLATFSTDHPDVELRLQAGWPEGEGLVAITEANASDNDLILSFFDTAPEVHSYEVLHTDDTHIIIQALIEKPDSYRAARTSQTLPRFPLVVRDGWIYNEMTTSHEQLSRFRTELETADVNYEVISIMQSPDPSSILTDRQHELITEAIERGYYDSPRRCTLTNLANELGVNKATASGILHRAEGKLIKEFVPKPANTHSSYSDLEKAVK